MENTTLSFETCMDILDWFDDDMLHDIHEAMKTAEGEEIVEEAWDEISTHALALLEAAKGTENEYPGVVE